MKHFLFALAGLMLVASVPVRAAETRMDSQYCAKHCNAVELRKEVKSMEKIVAADKAAAKPVSQEKLAADLARQERVKKHLAQHVAELQDLQAELDKAEADLKALETK